MINKFACLYLTLCISIALPNLAKSQTQGRKRPNIVFILSDDHTNQAISAYGSKITTTPNIDRIAREGALFTNAMVTNSICGPSRAAFLTAKYSHVNGYIENEKKFNVNQWLFPAELQKHGYQTAWIGKWHLGSLPVGFDYWNVLPGQGHYYNPDFIKKGNDTVRVEGYVTDLITKFTSEWLDTRDTTKPFMLVVGEKATHRTWLPALEDLGAYDDKTFPVPSSFYDTYDKREAARNQDMTVDKTMRLKEDLKVHADFGNSLEYKRLNDEQRKEIADYYEGKVSKEFDQKNLSGKDLIEWKYQRYIKDYLSTANSLDRNIGRILDYLDKNGLSENTVVIYASDQGFYLGEHGWFDKRFMYEESLKTPFVIRYPGVTKPGSKIGQPILNIDWAPTLLEIAGVPVPKEVQGKSFKPLLSNNSAPWRKDVYYHYYEYPVPHHVYPHFGIRTDRYKLIRFYGESESWELFDLKKDPNEVQNVYDNKENQPLIRELKGRLKKLVLEYNDEEALTILNKDNKAL